MRRPIVVLVLLASMAAVTAGRNPVNRDPNTVEIITSDIPTFWSIFDRASKANGGGLFQRDYLDAGNQGLRDFASLEILTGEALAKIVAERPRYYAAIRQNTLALHRTEDVKNAVRSVFQKMKALYAEAVFPDVYFVISNFSAGGTFSEHGLIIGVEIYARDPQTPVDELPKAWRTAGGETTDLPFVVGHELIHAQQTSIDAPSQTLLMRALREGSADFIGELITGGIFNRVQHSYGDAHEQELWTEFVGDMHGTDVRNWLFGGAPSGDRPTDLGYYIGYKICQAFYQRAPNKPEALREIIQLRDPDTFLRQSNYLGRSTQRR